MNGTARIAASLVLALAGATSLAAQEGNWVETRFHRVHLQNGNFIDGHVLKVTDVDVEMRLPVGDIIIKKNSVERIELIKLRSLQEKPKLDPPLRKTAAVGPSAPPAPASRLKSSVFTPAPADPDLVENVSRILSRVKVSKPDQRENLIEAMSGLDQAGAYLASLIPIVDEDAASVIRAALVRSKDATSAPYLVRALDSDRLHVKIFAINLLGIVGSREHALQIRPFLDDPHATVRSMAIESLQQLNDPAYVGAIAERIGDKDDAVRIAAITASLELGQTHNRMDLVTDAIRRGLNDSQGRAGKDLLGAVGRGRMTSLWTSVLPYLRNDDPLLRKAAASALVSLAMPESADAIVVRLQQEEDVRTLVELAKAATAVKSTATIPALIHLLRHDNDSVMQSAAAALTTLTRQKFGTNAAKWSEWYQRNSGR